VLRKLYLRKGNILLYLRNIGTSDFDQCNTIGIFGAILAAGVWIWFLRRLDVFEPEEPGFVALAFSGGAVGAVFCAMGYDFFKMGLGFDLNGGWLNDLVYCVEGIGFTEETAKVVPFLILYRFSRQMNEPVDFIIYAALSALGFSFT
jgi:RsiW-degrading membrane proteinase PrsW (M82 family)